MLNPLDSVNNALNKLKPFDLKINGKSFKLDYECFLYQDREQPLILKVALFNTYLTSIDNCSLEIAGVEVFKSMNNIENPTTDLQKANDGIVNLTQSINEVTRELNFEARGIIPEIKSANTGETIVNTNVILKSNFLLNSFAKDNLKKIQCLKDRISNKKQSATFYIQKNKIIFINGNLQSPTEIKPNTSKFRIFEVEQNLNNELLLLKGIPQFLLEVGTQIKYKSKSLDKLNNKYQNVFAKKEKENTYIVDTLEIRVSTQSGVQAEYKCKTLDLIKREISNNGNK